MNGYTGSFLVRASARVRAIAADYRNLVTLRGQHTCEIGKQLAGRRSVRPEKLIYK
jgi:hypothetical protein